jgi:cytochrome c-type biogenesis protein CcmE
MKRNHIIALVLIAVAVGAILSTLGDASTYVTFDQAENDQGATYTVIGTLDTTMEMHYEPRSSLFYLLRSRQTRRSSQSVLSTT